MNKLKALSVLVTAETRAKEYLNRFLRRYRYKIMVVAAFICAAQTVMAQQKSIVIFVINDMMTNGGIEKAQIDILLDDTVKVPYKTLMDRGGAYRLELDFKAGRYAIVANKEGYKTVVKDFTLTTYRNSIKSEGTLLMEKERVVRLKEAGVRATRIKMMMRGDTVVYDADAFNLAEGSMLDALVQQLPGAELKDGQIKVNGKVIESLMLNGEDFFSGNPKIALQNLPAYTVKQIKVYDRATNDAYLKGANAKILKTDEHMVMDVRLKKNYSRGFIGNVDLGYGLPDGMYQGKIFGLDYFGHCRIAAFANSNNIKDTQVGRTGGNWDDGWEQDGKMNLLMGGLDFLYSRSKLKYTGNATLTREKPLVSQKESSVSFYDTGDVYGRWLSEDRNKKFHLMSFHHLQYSGDRVYAEINPGINYMHDHFSNLMRRAEFSADPVENYRLQSLDSLFAPSWTTSRYASALLNRQNHEQEGNYEWLIADAVGKATISFPELGDHLSLFVSGNYNRTTNDPLTSINRVFGRSGTGENTLQHEDYSSKTYTLKGGAAYEWRYMRYRAKNGNYWIVKPEINVERQHLDRTNTLYQLHQSFSDAGQGGIVPPSAIQPAQLAVDLDNSYHSLFTQNHYKPSIYAFYSYMPSVESGKQLTIALTLDDDMLNEHLNYHKDRFDRRISRFTHNLHPQFEIKYLADKEKMKSEAKFNYSYTETLPSIYYQLGTVNSSDLTNIFLDNANLRRSQTHSLRFYYNLFNKKKYSNLSLNAAYKHTDRAIANAKHYDRTTGVNTWLPENINGNWDTRASVNYTTPFGRGRAFQFSNYTSASFLHSVDYVTDTEDLQQSEVNNLSLSERASLSMKLGHHSISLSSGVSWLKSSSQRSNFADISAWNIRGGVNATVNLPHNWQIATDMNLLCRAGYTDSNLNTADWVWNASIVRTMLKGNLILKLNAVDLLNEISNIQHNVNAQGQTETWVNNLPRYVMLHVIYKLNVMLKKQEK